MTGSGAAAAARGALAVVGTGIRAGLQTTPEARALIESAGRVFYVLNDPLSEGWLRRLRPDAESLADAYRDGRPRIDSYAEMVDRLLAPARAGAEVCAVFYGHPGVFVRPAHEAVRRARAEGIDATLLPGVSAEDALFADLGVDPADRGCQSHEATELLLGGRRFDPTSALVLWQVGAIGETEYRSAGYRRAGLELLRERLAADYPPHHQVVLYEANELPIGPPLVMRMPLAELAAAPATARSTLFVPPLPARPRDRALADRLAAALASETR